MKPQWFVRRYKEGDEYGIAKLLKIEYGLDEDHWRRLWIWKCKNNPFGHITMVAEHDGQIVGHSSAIHVKMKIGNKIMVGSVLVDLIVHPRFRHQGMFKALNDGLLSETRRDGILILYSFPNKVSYPGFKKYGWTDVCEVPRFVKFHHIYDAFVEHLTSRYRIIRLMTEHRTSRLLMRFIMRVASVPIGLALTTFVRKEEHLELKNVQVVTITRFDDRIDNFWENISEDYQVIAVRDRTFLNWFYCERPYSMYTVLIVESNNKILGYMVLSIADQKSGCIVETLTHRDVSLVQLLLSKANEYFKRKRVSWISCNIMGNNLLHEVLRNDGFILIPSEGPVVVYVNSSRIPEAVVKDAQNWYVTYGA